MVRNIPHLALIPLVILWFGIGDQARIFLVILGVFFQFISTPLLEFDRSNLIFWK